MKIVKIYKKTKNTLMLIDSLRKHGLTIGMAIAILGKEITK